MKTRFTFFILLLSVLYLSCQKRIHFYSLGKFHDQPSIENEKYFSHNYKQKQNSLKKITSDPQGYSYYSWKTIRDNYPLHYKRIKLNNKTKDTVLNISIYRTIVNATLLETKNDSYTYIQKSGNVLMNNLYFLDDHRCVYVSFDDNRNTKQIHSIPMFFNKTNYKIPKNIDGRFKQLLRGYYTVDGDSLFIHLEKPYENSIANCCDNRKSNEKDIANWKENEFYIHAIIQDSSKILFKSMSRPNSPSKLYINGFTSNRIQFDNTFHKDAQPIFELVSPIQDVIYPPQMYLSTGFEFWNKREINPLHKKVTKVCPEFKQPIDWKISDITYTIFPDNINQNFRTYHLVKYNGDTKCEVVEFIGLDKYSENSISTW